MKRLIGLLALVLVLYWAAPSQNRVTPGPSPAVADVDGMEAPGPDPETIHLLDWDLMTPEEQRAFNEVYWLLMWEDWETLSMLGIDNDALEWAWPEEYLEPLPPDDWVYEPLPDWEWDDEVAP